jgi:hypothetical protein
MIRETEEEDERVGVEEKAQGLRLGGGKCRSRDRMEEANVRGKIKETRD